jgi:ribonuclease HI
MHIEIYTDGSSLGNPGPGGYGLILKAGQHYKELSAGYRLTTNNRMELLSVIVGLDSVTKGWVFSWVQKNFKDKKNRDLWERFLQIYPKHHVQFKWIRGHNNHPENERCDELAVAAATSGNLLIDEGYEAERD